MHKSGVYDMIKNDNLFEKNPMDDQQFILAIYDEYKQLMYQMTKNRISSPEVREDFIQTTMVKLIPKISNLRDFERCTLTAYIVSTIRNTIFDYYRQSSLRKRYFVSEDISSFNDDDFDDSQNGSDRPVEDLALSKVYAYELKTILDSLPERDQILLRGKYQLYLTDQELAQQLQCEPSSIRMMLTRARRHALTLLTEKGFQYEST